MSSCLSRCLRVPIAIRAFYESYLWILKTLLFPHPDLHPGLLAQACSDNPDLRKEVESFLTLDDERVLRDFVESSTNRVTLPLGTKLGDYEVQSLLGMGGMGEVYRACDPRLGRDVAIKVLPRYVSNDPERLRRFEREARAAAAQNHPNILAIFQMERMKVCLTWFPSCWTAEPCAKKLYAVPSRFARRLTTPSRSRAGWPQRMKRESCIGI